MRLKWKLASVLSDIVLILTQDRSTVCVERTIGSEIILDTPDGISFGPFGDGVNLDATWVSGLRRMYHTGEIILDAPDGTPR